MNIGFDAKRAYLNRSGLGNYSRNLLRSLIEFYPENNYTVFTPIVEATRFNSYLSAKENVKIVTPNESLPSALHSIWRSFLIPKKFAENKLDIYHGLSAELPNAMFGKKVKQVVTVHDLIFLRYPELYAKVDSLMYHKKTKYACKKADVIIAISEQTKRDLIEFDKVPENKIKVEYQSCDPSFYAIQTTEEKESIRAIYKLPSQYILFVGTIEERKNLLQLIKAVKALSNYKEIPIVVVGKKKKHFDDIQRYISHNNMNGQVLFYDNIPDHILPTFYQLASVFVYPSIFEGFGIPIIEAGFSRTPVITSTDSCFEEAGGKHTLYVNPTNQEELTDAIDKVLSDNMLRTTMVNETYQYVQKFKNEHTAASMIKLYKSLL